MKKITLQMIADHVGVSKALVSKALSNDPAVNDQTRETIWRTAGEMGYRIEKLKRTAAFSKTGNVAVLMPQAYLSDIEYWGKVIRGIDKALSEHGYSMILSGIDIKLPPEDALPSSIVDGKADGALLMGHMPEMYVKALADRSFPTVLVDSSLPNPPFDHVLANNYAGAYAAGEALLAAGHRRLAFVGDPETAWSFRERARGFEECVGDFAERTGENVDVAKIRGIGVSGSGNYTAPGFAEELKQALGNGQVSAVFCANDMLALEAVRQMREFGLDCPENVSVIGFDDLSLSGYVQPALSTVRVPKERIGTRAAELLIQRLRQPGGTAEQVLLATALIERSSVKRLPDAAE